MQIDAETGNFETYGELYTKCVSAAIQLQKEGFKNDDIIGICSYNHLNSHVPFIAGLFLGCRIVSFDPTLSFEDTVHLMKQVTPKMIFVSDNAVELIEKSIREVNISVPVVIFGKHPKYPSFETYLQNRDQTDKFSPYVVNNMKDTAVIMFSSGTTGFPKGICLSHYAVLYESNVCKDFFISTGTKHKFIYNGVEASGKDPALSFASLYWISTVIFITSTAMGGTMRVICKEFNPKMIWETITKCKVNTEYSRLSKNKASPPCFDDFHTNF